MKRILLSLTVLSVLATQAQAGALTRVARIGALETSAKISSQKRLVELFNEELKIAQGHAEAVFIKKNKSRRSAVNSVGTREFARTTTKSGTEVIMSAMWTRNPSYSGGGMILEVSGKEAQQVSDSIEVLLIRNDLGGLTTREILDAKGEKQQIRVLLSIFGEGNNIDPILKALAAAAKNDFKPATLSRKSVSKSSK